MSRRSYKGNAASTKLASGIGSTDLSFTVTTGGGSGYPDGTGGPFFVVIDSGQSGEEKILVASRSGDTFTVSARGADDTTAAAHAGQATVAHCLTKTDLDEANAHVNGTSGVHGITGAVVGTTDSQTLSNKQLTQPVIADFTSAQHDHSTAAKGGVLPLTSVNGAADDATVVHKTGTETVAGAKTFSTAPTAPGFTVSTPAGHTGNTVVTPGVTGRMIETGTVTVTWAGTALADSAAVSFSTAFAAAPRVFIQSQNRNGFGVPQSVSTTGFQVHATTVDQSTFTGSVSFDWLAIGS